MNKFGFYFIADDWRLCSRTWKEKDWGDFRSSHRQYCASEYEGRFHSPLQLQTSTNIYDLYKYCWGKTMVLVDDKLFLPITILDTSSTNHWLYCVLTTNGTCTNFNHSDGSIAPMRLITHSTNHRWCHYVLTIDWSGGFQIVVFIVYAEEQKSRGVATTATTGVPLYSPLLYKPDRRYEAWRFVTYMLLHQG